MIFQCYAEWERSRVSSAIDPNQSDRAVSAAFAGFSMRTLKFLLDSSIPQSLSHHHRVPTSHD